MNKKLALGVLWYRRKRKAVNQAHCSATTDVMTTSFEENDKNIY